MTYESSLSLGLRARPAQRLVTAIGRLLAQALRAHWVYLIIIAIYAAACFLVSGWSGGGAVVTFDFTSEVLFLLVFLAGLGWFAAVTLWVMVRLPEESLFIALWRAYRNHFLNPRRIVYFAVAALPMPLFFSALSSFKRMIPFVNPYSWDQRFMEWDRALHGGWHPWELLQSALGFPLMTSAVNYLYNLWLFVLFLTLIWQCWTRRDDLLRAQYLLSFLLCWILLGTVLATVLASGGPVYYGRLTGLDDPFTPLMDYLYTVGETYPVWALGVQEKLWATYVNRGTDLGHGISAMPSLHVSTTVLMALLGWRIHRWVGIAYTVFAIVILLGSVHLAWHYAIDGYVSVVLTIVIWWTVGKALRRSVVGQTPRGF